MSTPAQADKKKGSVTVNNCTKAKATVCIYNGVDTLKAVNRGRRTLVPGKSWKVRCNCKYIKGVKTKGCGYCKVYLVSTAGNMCPVNPSGSRLKKVGFNANVYVGSNGKGKSQRLDVGTTSHCEK